MYGDLNAGRQLLVVLFNEQLTTFEVLMSLSFCDNEHICQPKNKWLYTRFSMPASGIWGMDPTVYDI